jgi:hypothetical protein
MSYRHTINVMKGRRAWLLSATGVFFCAISAITYLLMRNKLERTKHVNARGLLFRIAFALREYKHEHGRLPALKDSSLSKHVTHSWRSQLALFLEPRIKFAFDRNAEWNSPENLSAAREARQWFQISDTAERMMPFTQILAIDVIDGPWREDQANSFDKDPLLVYIQDSNTCLFEARDLSKDELYAIVLEHTGRGVPVFAISLDGTSDVLHLRHAIFSEMAATSN